MSTRTAIIGLSSTATTSWAANAHLPGLRRSSRFQIAALCNSSRSAAEAAIAEYDLDASTGSVTPYGSPGDLAADRTIDLVICSTRVDRHYETALPMIQAGKSTYIEWPIASHPTHLEELLAARRRSGAQVAVGLQSRFAPPVRRIRDLLQSGELGRLLNTEVRAFGGTLDREFLPPGLAYFAQRSVGGNPITIGFAHVIDFVQSVVGDVIPETDHIQFQLQRPSIRLREPTTGSIVETIRSDVPDLVSLHGHLSESAHVAAQASLVAYFSRGQPFPGDPQLTWTLTFEQGAVRLISPAGIVLGANTYAEPVTISVHRFDTGEVESVPWAWSPEQEELPFSARSVQSCLVSLAEGDSDGYVSLEQAAARARQIARWLDSFPA